LNERLPFYLLGGDLPGLGSELSLSDLIFRGLSLGEKEGRSNRKSPNRPNHSSFFYFFFSCSWKSSYPLLLLQALRTFSASDLRRETDAVKYAISL
jgi:hypothetical protein